MSLDENDVLILQEMQKKARISYKELSELTNIPSSTLHDKLNRLTEQGIIKEYITIINEEAIGCNQTAIIGIETGAEFYEAVADALTIIDEITEVYGATAQYDLMIKLRAYNRVHLSEVLNKIRNIKGVNDINVAIILEVFKEKHTIPIMPEYIQQERQ